MLQYVECIYLMCTGYWVFPMILGLISLTANMGILADLSRRHKTMTGIRNPLPPRCMAVLFHAYQFCGITGSDHSMYCPQAS